MLQKLSVENYALIDHLELTLSNSLNIITGETGAGKSILLGALGLLLGNRCDSTAVKDGERNCIIEGVFEIGAYHLEAFFEEHDLDYDATTIVRRVIAPTGKSRAYINDLPVQVTMLREFGLHLIDIHSQHQSLLIGEENYRTSMVDAVAGHTDLLADYSTMYHTLRLEEHELERLREEAEQNRRDEEWVRYQYDQLAQAQLKEDEQEELEAQQRELAHAEEIKEAFLTAVEQMEEEESGILSRLKATEQALTHIETVSPHASELTERLRSTLVELRDIDRELTGEADRIEADPAALQQIEERLNTIYTLQQKHKAASVAELLALQQEYERHLQTITGSDETIAALEHKIAELRKKAQTMADRISANRRKAADRMAKYVEEVLGELGMPGSHFIAEITPADGLRASGNDNIRFLFSANKNIAPAPVEKIASGGEISRLMLALKSLAARSSKLPTIIFDEIDTGVSGRIADAMGEIISGLAQSMQVVNITHLPQVACKGDTHFLVYKDNSGERSRTQIRLLSPKERVGEIAKMLSGSHITEAAMEQARLLLAGGQREI